MRLRKVYLFLAASVLAFACTKAELTEFDVADKVGTTDEIEDCYEEGVANVYLSEALAEAVEADLSSDGIVTRASSEGISELYSSLGIVSMRRLFPDAGEYEPRTRREGLHRWYKVAFDPSTPTTRATAGFRDVEGVEIAEPVHKIKLLATFNDQYFPYQWHFYNDGSLGKAFTEGCDIDVVPVWENFTTGNRDVIVGIVDGGIDYSCADIAGNYVGGYNFVYDDDTVTPDDHGTFVAGTIGAVNNNRTGCCGIAGGDYAAGVAGCGLLSCQMFSGDYSGDSAAAIKYGADNGAVISQNSWGYGYNTESQAENGSIGSADKAAIDYFVKYAGCDNDGNQLPNSLMKGGLVVFAAGNDGWAYGWPAEYEEVVAVGATGPSFNAAYYTNYGDWVDICAPGGDESDYPNSMCFNLLADNYIGWMEGTSMACPHVSGVAALIVSYFGGQGFTVDDLKEKLFGGADRDAVDSDAQIGPLLDAMGSFSYGDDTPPDPVASYDVSASANNLTFTWDVTSSENGFKAYGYMLVATASSGVLASADPNNPPSGVYSAKVSVGSVKSGEEMSGVLRGLDFTTNYYVGIYGYNYSGSYSKISEIKTVSTKENNPPEISTTYTGSYNLKALESIEVPFTVTEPDGHDFTVDIQHGSVADDLVYDESDPSACTLVINAVLVDAGTYTATIVATDSYGLSASYPVTYTVAENSAPELVGQMEGVIFTTLWTSNTYDITGYFSDPDGDDLTFEVESKNPSVVYAGIDGNKTLILTSMAYGGAEVSVVGVDPKGKSATMTVEVLVSDGSTEPKAYPNPVSDILYVSILTNTEATFVMHSSTGAKVYEATENVSAFRPAEIDVSGFAPGHYTLTVSYDGMSYDLKVTKI